MYPIINDGIKDKIHPQVKPLFLNMKAVNTIVRKLITGNVSVNQNPAQSSLETIRRGKIFNIGKTAEPNINKIVQPSKINGKMRRSRILRKKSLCKEVSISQLKIIKIAQNDKLIIGKIP